MRGKLTRSKSRLEDDRSGRRKEDEVMRGWKRMADDQYSTAPRNPSLSFISSTHLILLCTLHMKSFS